MKSATALCVVAVVALLGSASACQPPDCTNVDYGTCGNACCNITVTIHEDVESVKNLLFDALSNGGPDGRYKLSMTAEGTLGFADLRPYHIGISFLGQAIHHTKVHHYNDTVNLGLYATGSNSTLVTAFSISGIAGAYGDGGQNFKNLIQIFQDRGMPKFMYKIERGCPPKAGTPALVQQQAVVETAPEPENLHASCRLTWTFSQTDCASVSTSLATAARGMAGFAHCDSSEKCGYTVISANSTELVAYHKTPVHHYRDDISISFQALTTGGCTAHGYSTSTIWYAVLDDGTNYCNLHNLAEATGLQFSENVDKSDCTQYSSANCSKY